MKIWIYRLIVAPMAVVGLPIAALFHKKIREGLKMRMETRPWPSLPNPIWIHASSGEFEYAKSLIREIKNQYPHEKILVTYFSPTYRRQIEGFPGVDLALPLPLDLPGPCRSFVKHYHPKALLLARTDFWPELLTQAQSFNIPRTVFAYTQKPIRGRLQTILARWRLQLVDHIYCVSHDDQSQTQRLVPDVLSDVCGDPRYDQVHYRLNHPKPLNDGLRPNGICLVAGSVWAEDEAVLIPAWADLLRSKQIKLILVPHEPTTDHLVALTRLLERHQLTHALYSEGRPWDDKPVLIVDQVGILAELYAWGRLAFIGGSFRGSVHSVMEALGSGCPTLVGPYHTNNREALEFAHVPLTPMLRAVTVASDAKQARQFIENYLASTQSERDQATQKLHHVFQKKLGASRHTLEIIEQHVLS